MNGAKVAFDGTLPLLGLADVPGSHLRRTWRVRNKFIPSYWEAYKMHPKDVVRQTLSLSGRLAEGWRTLTQTQCFATGKESARFIRDGATK